MLSFGETIPKRSLVTDRNPPHFIVPHGDPRYLCIRGAKPGIKVTVTPASRVDIRVMKAAETVDFPDVQGHYQWFRIYGGSHGRAKVVFEQGSDSLTLKCEVYHWRKMHVNFYLVKDKHGKPNFNGSQTGTHISRLDRVYRPQTCVDFHRHLPTKEVSVDIDCSKKMTAAQEQNMWDLFLGKTLRGVRGDNFFNIFVVKAWGGHDNSSTGYNAWATSHGGLIVIDDSALSNDGPVLPHELGHSLGLSHANSDGYVMRQGLNKGWKLTWDNVKTVRRFVS